MSTPTIPDDELHVTYILASGPGGQNVNKVATAAQLRFDARNSPTLSQRMKRRLVEIAGSRMTGDGVIVLTARRFRSQIRNREDAVARLHDMIAQACTVQACAIMSCRRAT
ncbi:aminoacyl-tRNA hydrolase, partial [Komagataeibacter melaceti]